MSEIEKPVRAVTLELKIEADTRQDMIYTLQIIATDIAMGKMTKGCSGSYSSGYTYEYKESDSPTHDEWFEHLTKYLEQERKAKPTQED
jgi:hypothetical protein